MTDTGQVPAEGLPENAGMVEQPGVPAHGAYTYLSETTAEDEDLLLLPGAQGAWGNEVPPPAPEPVVETVHEPAAHEPGPHETAGRDSGSVDLGGVRLPEPSPAPVPPRRPLHLGPPLPDLSASPVRSLADRGPAGAPVRQSGPPTTGPEYFDAPQLRDLPPQGAAPWGAQSAVSTGAPTAETVVPHGEPGSEPGGAAQAATGSVATALDAESVTPELELAVGMTQAPDAGEVWQGHGQLYAAETAVSAHVGTEGSGTDGAPEAAQLPDGAEGSIAGQVHGQGSETGFAPAGGHGGDAGSAPEDGGAAEGTVASGTGPVAEDAFASGTGSVPADALAAGAGSVSENTVVGAGQVPDAFAVDGGQVPADAFAPDGGQESEQAAAFVAGPVQDGAVAPVAAYAPVDADGSAAAPGSALAPGSEEAFASEAGPMSGDAGVAGPGEGVDAGFAAGNEQGVEVGAAHDAGQVAQTVLAQGAESLVAEAVLDHGVQSGSEAALAHDATPVMRPRRPMVPIRPPKAWSLRSRTSRRASRSPLQSTRFPTPLRSRRPPPSTRRVTFRMPC